MFCSCSSGIRVINPTKIGQHKNSETPIDVSTDSEDVSSEKKTR